MKNMQYRLYPLLLVENCANFISYSRIMRIGNTMDQDEWGTPSYPDEEEELDYINNGKDDAAPEPDFKPTATMKRPRAQDLVKKSYPKQSVLDRMFGKSMLLVAIGLGVLLIFFGSALMVMGGVETTQEEVTGGLDTQTKVTSEHSLSFKIGALLFDLGVLMAALPLSLIHI